MQAKPLATNLGEQANKIAVSVQSGDGEVLTLWGMPPICYAASHAVVQSV